MTTLEALKLSIKKWEKIVTGKGRDLGTENCALCRKFYEEDCIGCPVMKRTGEILCGGSPYEQWNNLFLYEEDCVANTPERKAAAQAELDFLRSLLPDVEAKS